MEPNTQRSGSGMTAAIRGVPVRRGGWGGLSPARYPIALASSTISRRFSAETPGAPLSARDTVDTLTPAASAMTAMPIACPSALMVGA